MLAVRSRAYTSMNQSGADYFYKLAMESRVAALSARDPQAKWRDAEDCWLALASQMEANHRSHTNQDLKERREP